MIKYGIKVIFNIRNFFMLWVGQSVSQFGSTMTGFAVIIWAYRQTNSVLSVSLLSVFSYLPYILVSIFAGTLVDKYNKKLIILSCDSVAACCPYIYYYLFFYI